MNAPASAASVVFEEVELHELVKAIRLFLANYQRMHARTAYAERVDSAALRVKEKLLELQINDVLPSRNTSRPEL